MTTGPPWPCSSRTSSPVKEFGRRKVEGEPRVDVGPVAAPEAAQGGIAGTGQSAEQGPGDAGHGGPGDADDADPAEPGRGGDGGDGLRQRTAPRRRGYLAAASILRVMCHCWAMDRMLFTVQ